MTSAVTKSAGHVPNIYTDDYTWVLSEDKRAVSFQRRLQRHASLMPEINKPTFLPVEDIATLRRFGAADVDVS